MTLSFRYRAATAEGQLVEGVVQAPSQRGAIEELHRQTLYPIELASLAHAQRTPRRGARGRAPAVALLARTMATMLSAGIALDRALGFAAEQASHAEVADAARRVRAEVRRGSSLAQALAEHPTVFSSLFVTLVAAGEESGALDETMTRIADHLEELVELRARIRSALLYPALMAIASGVGTLILLLFVVPRFVAMLEDVGGALPLSTRLLVGASTVVVDGWWLLLLVGTLLALAWRSWLARPDNRRRWHAWRIRTPLVGRLEINHTTARFTRALALLLGSGHPILPSLRVARAIVANAALGATLDRATEEVRRGTPLHAALTGTLPALATEMIAVGEESGRLDDLCLRVADSYDNDVARALRTLVAVIEPALILLFALIVGFVALAMLQAIYSLNASVL
ncbi:MAG: type II secretion system F family protein [Gemmatimonadetes bacterium]|nr:type II secretion system F family protein [Gemmatimonadota bacterium]